MIPVIDTKLCSYYIPMCKQKESSPTLDRTLVEEINYKDVSLKRPSL